MECGHLTTAFKWKIISPKIKRVSVHECRSRVYRQHALKRCLHVPTHETKLWSVSLRRTEKWIACLTFFSFFKLTRRVTRRRWLRHRKKLHFWIPFYWRSAINNYEGVQVFSSNMKRKWLRWQTSLIGSLVHALTSQLLIRETCQ